MIRKQHWGPLIALVMVMVAGCGNKGDDLKTMSVDETTKIVESYAQTTVDMIGGTRLDHPGSGKAPCEGRGGELASDDGPYFVQGTYNVPLPQDKHLQTLERLRDQWTSQGYEVTNFRKFQDNGAEVDVRNPKDSFKISLTSTATPTALALFVSSPCFMPPKK